MAEGKISGKIFFLAVLAVAVLIVFFARQDNTSPFASDTNSTGLFGAIDSSGSAIVPLGSQPAQVSEVFFCPQDNCAQKLVKHIDAAQKTIDMAIYSFTLDDVADALIRAKNRGVEVKVIFDYDQSTNAASDDEKLAAAGISVSRRNGSGYMHNKFTVIDGNVVATGSFNYSQNADTKNDENLVFIEGEAVAKKFTEDFDKLWEVSDRV